MLTNKHTPRFAADALGSISLGMCALLAGQTSHAARPLTTDDAAVNPPGTCQVEAWQDQERDASKHMHLAPACGVVPGLEMGAEVVRSSPSEEHLQARAIGVKWVPAFAQFGAWQFGLKGGVLSQKPPGEQHWRAGNWSAQVLASRELSTEWSLHVNAGHLHDTDLQSNVTSYGAALSWTPHPRMQIFAEVIGDTRAAVQKGVGMRWWLLPDQLGLDVTAARNGAGANTSVWGIGLGWYGISF